MNTKESLQRLVEITNHYIQELDAYSEEQLRRQPDEESWSLGQMYLHLIQAANFMQLGNAEKCKQQSEEAEAVAEGKTEAGEAIFRLGGFPPIQIKVPASPQYTPRQAESKQELIAGMQDVLRRASELEQQLATIPPQITAAHPRLGGLNATEWFLLIEMHYRHHLLQKERLQQFLAG